MFKIKIVFLLSVLSLSGSSLFGDTINFYEGYNQVKEINCMVLNIDSVFAKIRYIYNQDSINLKIHISRIYFIKFNKDYTSDEDINREIKWQEFYNMKIASSDQRIYLNTFTDSLKQKYKGLKFSGRSENILTGNIKALDLAGHILVLKVMKKSGHYITISDWQFYPALATWYPY